MPTAIRSYSFTTSAPPTFTQATNTQDAAPGIGFIFQSNPSIICRRITRGFHFQRESRDEQR